MSGLDKKRLLLKHEKLVREINREEINPKIPELKLSDLNPVVKMVAQARANYIKGMFDLSNQLNGVVPTQKQIHVLKLQRETYEELVEGSIALEVAIERGYLDVES